MSSLLLDLRLASKNLVGLFVLFLLGPGTAALAESSKLIPFEIEDQFDQVHTDADVRGHVVIVTGSDKDGSPFNGRWNRAIIEDLDRDVGIDSIAFVGVADLRGVPFFLKGMIKGKFPQKPEQGTLMDWKGLFAKTYRFEPKASNILVFSPDGDLLIRAHGREVDPEKVGKIGLRIRDALSLSENVDHDTRN